MYCLRSLSFTFLEIKMYLIFWFFFKYLLWNLSWQHTVKIDKRTIVNNHYCFYTVSHRRTISSLKTEIKCLKKAWNALTHCQWHPDTENAIKGNGCAQLDHQFTKQHLQRKMKSIPTVLVLLVFCLMEISATTPTVKG